MESYVERWAREQREAEQKEKEVAQKGQKEVKQNGKSSRGEGHEAQTESGGRE